LVVFGIRAISNPNHTPIPTDPNHPINSEGKRVFLRLGRKGPTKTNKTERRKKQKMKKIETFLTSGEWIDIIRRKGPERKKRRVGKLGENKGVKCNSDGIGGWEN